MVRGCRPAGIPACHLRLTRWLTLFSDDLSHELSTRVWDHIVVDGMKVPSSCPPTFMVHTHDDRSTSLGSVAFYVGLKQNRIPAALHVYANGGHGYGTRAVSGSQVGNWPAEAVRWIETLK